MMTRPTSEIMGVKNYNKKKKRWEGVVCQIIENDEGKENILILDVMSSSHEIDIDNKIEESIKTKPWLIQ